MTDHFLKAYFDHCVRVQAVKNVSFSEYFAYVLNDWFPVIMEFVALIIPEHSNIKVSF